MIKAHKDGNLRPISIQIGIYSNFIVDWCLGIADRWYSSCGCRCNASLKRLNPKQKVMNTSAVVVTVVIVLSITVVGRP